MQSLAASPECRQGSRLSPIAMFPCYTFAAPPRESCGQRACVQILRTLARGVCVCVCVRVYIYIHTHLHTYLLLRMRNIV